jgi:predicted GIY-YIG superfamily endonuclease
LIEHNPCKGKYTGKADDWVVIFTQVFENRGEAMIFESKIKNTGAKGSFQNLLVSVWR